MTAFTSTKKGVKHAKKTMSRIAGFQRGGIDVNDLKASALVVPGKVHPFVESSHLLGITIEHLCANAIGVKQ
jgi:hypothetical protein